MDHQKMKCSIKWSTDEIWRKEGMDHQKDMDRKLKRK